jgi:hypothetical protein
VIKYYGGIFMSKKKKVESDYKTLALAEHAKKEDNTDVFMPDIDNVKEAKNWVDFNEK